MKKSVFEIWRDIYFESVVEHDHRLRLLARTTPTVSYEDIVYADKKAPIFYKNYNSEIKPKISVKESGLLSTIFFLEKSAPKSKILSTEVNKEIIYSRTEPDATCWFSKPGDNEKLYINLPLLLSGLETFWRLGIHPRKRWFKLYDSKHPFSRTQELLADQLCSLQSQY